MSALLPARSFDLRILRSNLGFTLAGLLVVVSRLTAAEPGTDKPKEGAEPLAVPNWSVTAALSSVVGYRDNVGLSAVNPDGSGFLKGGLEAMFLRLPERGFDGYVFLDLSETRYFSSAITDYERSAIMMSEAGWQSSDKIKMSLQVLGYHNDLVSDVSVDASAIDTSRLKVTGGSFSPAVRWNLPRDWWVEARGTGRKDHYAQGVDGYTEGEGSASLGQNWGYGSEWSITGARRWRAHDTREQYTVRGYPKAGTRLKIQQSDFTLNYVFVPDEAKTWQVSLTAFWQKNKDNGSGYFDFNRQQLTAGLSWKKDAWEVTGSVSAAQNQFPVQRSVINPVITDPKLYKKDYRLTVEVSRRINAAWSVLAFYETEQAVSNDDRSRFRINTGYVGLQWSWDNLGLE